MILPSSFTFEDFRFLVLTDPTIKGLDRDLARQSRSKLSEAQDLLAMFAEIQRFFSSSEQLVQAVQTHRKEILANHEAHLLQHGQLRLRVRKGMSVKELLSVIVQNPN